MVAVAAAAVPLLAQQAAAVEQDYLDRAETQRELPQGLQGQIMALPPIRRAFPFKAAVEEVGSAAAPQPEELGGLHPLVPLAVVVVAGRIAAIQLGVAALPVRHAT